MLQFEGLRLRINLMLDCHVQIVLVIVARHCGIAFLILRGIPQVVQLEGEISKAL